MGRNGPGRCARSVRPARPHVDVSVSDAAPDDRYQANLGVQGQIAADWTVWGRVGQEWGKGDYERFEGQLGVRYRW